MTTEENWQFINEALTAMMVLSDEIESAQKPLILNPESPLVEPVWRTQALAVDALEKLIGDKDQNINWFVFECDFGRDSKQAGCKDDMRFIETIDDLRWLCDLECV